MSYRICAQLKAKPATVSERNDIKTVFGKTAKKKKKNYTELIIMQSNADM